MALAKAVSANLVKNAGSSVIAQGGGEITVASTGFQVSSGSLPPFYDPGPGGGRIFYQPAPAKAEEAPAPALAEKDSMKSEAPKKADPDLKKVDEK